MSIIYGDYFTGDFIGGYDNSFFKGRKQSLYFFNRRGVPGNFQAPLLVDLLNGLKSSGVNTAGLVGAEAAFANYSGYFASDLIPSGSLLIDGDLLVSGSIYITGSDGRLVSITGGGGAGGACVRAVRATCGLSAPAKKSGGPLENGVPIWVD